CNNANLTDSNSNEANFSDRAIWDTIRPASILEGNVTKCPGRQCGAQTGRLDNRRLSGSGRTVNIRPATTGNRNELPRDSNLTEDDLAGGDDAPGLTDNGRLPASSSSSASSASSSGSASSSASPLASPASPIEGGIVNPNYPGFEHLAAKLLKLAAGSDCEDQDDDDDDDDDSNNNNIISADLCGKQSAHRLHRRDVDDCKRIDPVNRDHADGGKALLYAKPKLAATMADAFLSSAKEELSVSRDFQKQAKLHKMSAHNGPPLGPLGALAAHRFKKDSNRALEERDEEEEEKYNREATEKELHHQDVVVPRKKEKMAMNQQVRKARAGPPGLGALERAERAEKRFASHAHAAASRREKRSSLELLGGFDVYNIETAMPRIDLDLIESHLRAAKEEER
ncbi:Hydrocephalus-inducing protein, partial [Frankliniella fusca]